MTDPSGMGDVRYPPLDTASALHSWMVTPITDVLVALTVLAYLWRAYRVLPRLGHRWPARSTAAFLGGAAVLLLTLQSFIGVYAVPRFSVHMILHLLLIMVVPVLIILGRPIALLMTGGDATAHRTDAALGSRIGRLLTFPGIGFAIYGIVVVGTHLTPFLQLMIYNDWMRPLEEVLYLGGGYLFFLPLMKHEPLRKQWSYPMRMFMLLLGMTVDTVVGVLLMVQFVTPFPGYAIFHPDWTPAQLLSDVRTGGAIMWVFGDALMFAVIAAVLRSWVSDTSRQNDTGSWLEAARRSALASQTGETRLADAEDVDDEEALAAYNRMLARLHQQEMREHDQHR